MKCSISIEFESQDTSHAAAMLGCRNTQLRDCVVSEVTKNSDNELEKVIKEVTDKIRNGWKFAESRVASSKK